MANRIIFGEFAANIKSSHSQGYSPSAVWEKHKIARHALPRFQVDGQAVDSLIDDQLRSVRTVHVAHFNPSRSCCVVESAPS